MAYRNGTNSAPYAIIAALMLIIVVMISFILADAASDARFDDAIERGDIVITGNPIEFGATGHPYSNTEYIVPNIDAGGLFEYPRSTALNGCETQVLPEGAKRVYAATSAPQEVANLIQIQMPIEGSNVINICGPESITTQIYLWVD